MTRGPKCIAALLAMAVLLTTGTAAAATAPRIEVLSNRADLISGGDALVRVTPAPSQVTVAGRDVTSVFVIIAAALAIVSPMSRSALMCS